MVLLFAGWFLDRHDPPKLSSFDRQAVSQLRAHGDDLSGVCCWRCFSSAFSLPTDFKNRTIYTVVTKPVRPGEIVLGRILGFTVIGTVLLAIMGAVSYVFAYRMLDHTHEVDVASLQPAGATRRQTGKNGRTSFAHGHRHDVRLDADGKGKTDTQKVISPRHRAA